MYYEATISRIGLDDSGKEKKFNEKYLVEAQSITEAVMRFEQRISEYYPEHETKSVKRVGYSEVLADEGADSRYFHIAYNTLTIDDCGKERKSKVAILIQANDFDEAKAKFADETKTYVVDIELVKLVESKILDYFPEKVG